MSSELKRIEEVDIARGLGIILVMVGHSIPDANIGIQNIVAAGIFKWIYSFHMALFMCMSGMLFLSKRERVISAERKYRIKIIAAQAKRLLIPYCFFSIIMLLLKALTNMGRDAISLNSVQGMLFGNSPCGNMWFLWTLFIIQVIIICLPSKIKLNQIIGGGGNTLFHARPVALV